MFKRFVPPRESNLDSNHIDEAPIGGIVRWNLRTYSSASPLIYVVVAECVWFRVWRPPDLSWLSLRDNSTTVESGCHIVWSWCSV